MPRAPRVEYPGALYHTMSRGDRREPIYLDEGDREMFLATLAEACSRTGWRVHSYVLMDNHYHCLLQTPVANLVKGMKWLQGAYTQRFNARHGFRGHVFQGRYKSLLVDPEEPEYARVVSDYIHLNPARAGLLEETGKLESHRWSSYGHFLKPRNRPGWLEVGEVYGWHHWDWRRVSDRKRYGEYMQMRVRETLEGRVGGPVGEMVASKLRRGWVLGSEKFVAQMEEMAAGVIGAHKRLSYKSEGARAYDEGEAQRLLEAGMDRLKLRLAEVKRMPKNEPRKQGLAWLIKSRTTTGDAWLCEKLELGDPSNVSRAVLAFRREDNGEVRSIKKRLQLCRV